MATTRNPVTMKRGDVIKVASSSPPTSVAGAIAGMIRDNGTADVQAVGAGAVNQAVKAIAIAQKYLEENKITINMQPSFVEIQIGQNERTAIRFNIKSDNDAHRLVS